MKHIDARGKACPIPVLLAKQAITDGESAFSIQVDNPAAVENLHRLASNQGFSVSAREEEGLVTLCLSRSGLPAPACDGRGEASPAPADGCPYTLFVGRDVIGSGDRELGTNLMRMFFYTLAQSEEPPRSILFMNDGVKLPAGDGQVIEHLRSLQAGGTEILVCGTCLNFYGLTHSLPVGEVSNMYDILARMQAVPKVITL